MRTPSVRLLRRALLVVVPYTAAVDSDQNIAVWETVLQLAVRSHNVVVSR